MDRYHPRPKFNRSFDSLRRFMRNKYPFGQPNCDYCVEFLTATQRINDLSCGAHQWVSVPVTGIYLSSDNRSRLYLIVCYSSPDATGLPNHLCFCLPLFVDRSDPGSGLKLLACFAPESIVPLSKGLYFEDGVLKTLSRDRKTIVDEESARARQQVDEELQTQKSNLEQQTRRIGLRAPHGEH